MKDLIEFLENVSGDGSLHRNWKFSHWDLVVTQVGLGLIWGEISGRQYAFNIKALLFDGLYFLEQPFSHLNNFITNSLSNISKQHHIKTIMTLKLLISSQNMFLRIFYDLRKFLDPLGDNSQHWWGLGIENTAIDLLSWVFGYILVNLATD